MIVLVVATLYVPAAWAFHYERPPCQSDEVVGEVQGVPGSCCSPKCRATNECSADIPDGTIAKPQCMLKDVDGDGYCGLLCKFDSECPNGALCKQQTSPEIGICMYPVSFTDWAHQSKTKKLRIGWPGNKASSRSDSSSSSVTGAGSAGQIAKVYGALQTLKRKYMIEDGDADMLLVKELLSDMSRGGGSSVTRNTGASDSKPKAKPAPSRQDSRQDMDTGAWKHDVNYITQRVEEGLPGLAKEVHDTVWNVEHITKRHAASDLLRGILGFGFVYLVVGAIMRSNSGYAGIGLIPHFEFWREYPGLVLDGMAYTRILVANAMGQPYLSTVYSASRNTGFKEIGAHEIDNMGGTFSSRNANPVGSQQRANAPQPQFSTEGQGSQGLL